jgi:hypothetical protein
MVLPACVAAGSDERHGLQSEHMITCTNPASGATWEIKVDARRAMVDRNPAQVSDTEISWRDATDGRSYTLDRASGELTAIVASSTGGWIIHNHCVPMP